MADPNPHIPAGTPPEKGTLRELFTLAAPTIATMSSYTLMQFADGIMVSRIQPASDVYFPAHGNGMLASFVPIAFMFGLLQIVSTFVSQNFGAGSPRKGVAYVYNGFYLCAIASILIVPYAMLLPRLFALDLVAHSEELQRLEVAYAQIVLMGAFFTLGAKNIAQFFFGVHKPVYVLAAALSGNITNIALNTVLIFGSAGAPETLINAGGDQLALVLRPVADAGAAVAGALSIEPMGISGAAYAFVAGVAVELLVPLVVFLSPRFHKTYQTRTFCPPSLAHIADILRVGWPAACMFGSEIICWAYFMTVLVGGAGYFDPDLQNANLTAARAVLYYCHLSFMPAVGLSIALAAITGRYMGMRRPDLAEHRARVGVFVTVAYMGLCAVLFVLFREQLVALFLDENLDQQTKDLILGLGSTIMIVAAVFQIFDAMAIAISGALRGAGDTFWPGAATTVLAWTCIVAGGHVALHFFTELQATGPWIGAAVYIILLGLFLVHRFFKGDWKSRRVLDESRVTAHVDPVDGMLVDPCAVDLPPAVSPTVAPEAPCNTKEPPPNAGTPSA